MIIGSLPEEWEGRGRICFPVDNEEHSKALQCLLFLNGFSWLRGKEYKYLDKKYIYAYLRDKQLTYSNGNDFDVVSIDTSHLRGRR